MSRWLCECFRKKPPTVDYWDCSHLRLTDLPVEIIRHRRTLTSLNISVNNVRDVPKVRRERERDLCKVVDVENVQITACELLKLGTM